MNKQRTIRVGAIIVVLVLVAVAAGVRLAKSATPTLVNVPHIASPPPQVAPVPQAAAGRSAPSQNGSQNATTMNAVTSSTDASHATETKPTEKPTPEYGREKAIATDDHNQTAEQGPVTIQQPQSAPSVAAMIDASKLSGNDAAFYAASDALQREVQILKLQDEVSQLQKKMRKDSESSMDVPPASPMALTPPAPEPGTHTTVISSIPVPLGQPAGSPRLVSVLSINGHQEAEVLDHGTRQSIQEGSVLPDGWRVESITPNRLLLRNGWRHKSVQIGG
jgi:type IV pilus biogenesis protein PilP